MSLRATSSILLSRINELEKIFKVWRIRGVVDKKKLRTIADISIIQGNIKIKVCITEEASS